MEPCSKYCPWADEQGTKKKVFLIHKIMDFQFFLILIFAHGST
jgi:hypothetical protein